MNDYRTRLKNLIEKKNALGKQIFSDVLSIDKLMTKEGIRCKKIPYNSRETILEDPSNWDEFRSGGNWGEPDTHFCFRVKLEIPESYRGKEVLFFLSTGADDIWNTDNPQMLIYVNGKRRCGMDLNHNSLVIYEKEDWEKNADRLIDIGIYAYSNLAENENLLNMEIAARNEAVTRAYFDFLVPLEAAEALLSIRKEEEFMVDTDGSQLECLDPEMEEKLEMILKTLEAAGDDISEYLRENLYGKDFLPVTVASVGHTHIDVAWKWQLRQTREKAIRSYSTVMELMGRYPEYRFMMSTPQLFEFIREDEPELFDEIKEKVKEGRFEPEGAMWLEADCNLTSGESLVRQILYGKRYFKDTFGIDSDILWLPDVFGYSAAMPQILKKSGIRAFVTTKLAWNDTNRLPHDLFYWKGIDGTRIPTYIITTCDYPLADKAEKTGGTLEYTYNGRQNASQIMGTYKAFREKDLTDETLTCFGFGDGGGGPTWEMLEMDKRLKMGVPACPRTQQKSVTEFFDKLFGALKDRSDVPEIAGELYLEYHRGTYTSMAQNKRYNRQLEHLLFEAELLLTYVELCGEMKYKGQQLTELWKVLMLNQFHDILPGSSIEGVYEDSKEQYEKAIADCRKLIEEACENATVKALISGLVDNGDTTKFEGTGGNDRETQLETPFYKVKFDKNGEIESLYDKELGREIRDMEQSPLNRLIAFEDKPKDYDAWNIDSNFEDVSEAVTELSEFGIDRKEMAVRIRRTFRASTIEQMIRFYPDSKRIDFETKADWHEHQTLLKAAFPVDVEATDLTCEIQYGSLKRKLRRESSIEKAKFECCAHSYIDMTADSGEFGVAILNDCKYGYDAKEKLMRQTLIKSGIFPNPNADQGIHTFTYSLYPHKGDLIEGKVIEEARALNSKKLCYKPKLMERTGKAIIDLGETEGVFVCAVKKAEDSDAIIIRIYEAYGRQHEFTAHLFGGFKDLTATKLIECDLLEHPLDGALQPDTKNNDFTISARPYEIKTYAVFYSEAKNAIK